MALPIELIATHGDRDFVQINFFVLAARNRGVGTPNVSVPHKTQVTR